MKTTELQRKVYVLDAVEGITFNVEMQQVTVTIRAGYHLTTQEIHDAAENHLRNLIAA